MKKYIEFTMLLLASSYAYSYKINIIDDHNLINKKYIEFNDKDDDLIKQIQEVTIELLNRGYVTSKNC